MHDVNSGVRIVVAVLLQSSTLIRWFDLSQYSKPCCVLLATSYSISSGPARLLCESSVLRLMKVFPDIGVATVLWRSMVMVTRSLRYGQAQHAMGR